jgi:hypothetical protein
MSENNPYSEVSLLQRNETQFLTSPLGEEIVMMNTDNGDYLGLDDIGADIWNILEQRMSVAVLKQHLLEVYNVTQEQLTQDLDLFLLQMIKHKMIVVIAPE